MGETTVLNLSFNFRSLNREELDTIYKNLPQLNTSGRTVSLKESAQQVLDWITGKTRFVSNPNEFNKFFIRYINEAIKVNVMTYNNFMIKSYAAHPGVNIDLETNAGRVQMNELLEDGLFNTDVYLVYNEFIRNIKLHIAAISYMVANNKVNPILPSKLPFEDITTSAFVSFTNVVTYDDIFKIIDRIIDSIIKKLSRIEGNIISIEENNIIIDLCLFSALLSYDFEGKGINHNLITYGNLETQPFNNIDDVTLTGTLNSEYILDMEE